MTPERSGIVGQLNGLKRRSRILRLFLGLLWCWLAARGTSWSLRSLRYLSATPGAIHRRLRTWEAALRPVIHDWMASERAARLVALLKKILALLKKMESRYPWRCWVRQTGDRCQRGWMLAVVQWKTGIGWLQNWPAGKRFRSSLGKHWIGLLGQIRQSERMKVARAYCRRVQSWCGRLSPYTKALTSAWPSTLEIIGEIPGEIPREMTGAAPAEERFQEAGLWVDSGSPFGYARIAAEYFPPPEPEVWEFQPDDFLLDLFRAYSQLLEQRGDGSPRLAPVVPLVDVFALLSSVRTVSPDDSPDYTKDNFIKDVYRLHASGVNTTIDGARISFPISRGVKGKTLTVTDEGGSERRYYGVRFLGQGSSG